jgi:hypothetical protein
MHRTTLLRLTGSAAALALALGAAHAQAADADAPATPPDLSALVECRLGHADFAAYLPVLQDPLKAVALGWRPLPQSNPFMLEYQLIVPITVFGRKTDHIAFAGDGVVAVLDLAEPRVLARELQLETGVDTPQKAIFGREARASEVTGPNGRPGWIDTAVINVSNVDSHPGKTLAGCSYSLDPPEPAEPAAPGTETAAPSPIGAHPR